MAKKKQKKEIERLNVGYKQGFVFDESRKTKVLNSTTDYFLNNEGKRVKFFGFLLPKEVQEEKDSKTISYQQNVHVLITNSKTFVEASYMMKTFNIKFAGVPLIECRWQLENLHDFTEGLIKIPSAREIYEKQVSFYKEHCFFYDEKEHMLRAIWDMGTYFFDGFEAYPYLEVVGEKGCGKTTSAKITEFTAKDGITFSSITAPTLFRYVHVQRPTMIWEEVQRLFSYRKGVDNDERIELLLIGYQKGALVPRTEKDSNGQFAIRTYEAYCPKLFVGTKEIPMNERTAPLKDRTISQFLLRADKQFQQPRKDDKKFLQQRNNLYAFALAEYETIMYLYHQLGKTSELKNRDLDKWKPLLALAELIGEDVKAELLKYAKKNVDISSGDLDELGWKADLIRAVHDLLDDKKRYFSSQQFLEALKKTNLEYERFSVNRVGSYLKTDLGFSHFWVRTREGNRYFMDKKDMEQVLKHQNKLHIIHKVHFIEDKPIKEESTSKVHKGSQGSQIQKNGEPIEPIEAVNLCQRRRGFLLFDVIYTNCSQCRTPPTINGQIRNVEDKPLCEVCYDLQVQATAQR